MWQRVYHSWCPCGQGGKELIDQGNLLRHRRTVHEGVKYPCGQCGKELTSQEYLAKHKKAVLEGQEELFNQCFQVC